MRNELLKSISFDEYRKIKAVNQTLIKEVLENPYYFANDLEKPKKESTALDFGSLLHDCILTPNELGAKYLFADVEKVDARTKEGKALKEQAASDGKILVDGALANLAWQIIEQNQPILDALIDREHGVCEATITGELYGFDCKARLDYFSSSKEILDLKFVQSSKPNDFAKTAANFGYHIQAAFYQMLAGTDSFTFLAIEKEAPFMVGIYELDSVAIDLGKEKIKKAFEIMLNKKHYMQNIWKNEADLECTRQVLSLPAFAFYE